MTKITAEQIAKNILYLPVTNGQSEESISKGARWIEEFTEQKTLNELKEYTGVKNIVINIKEGEGKEPTSLSSIPDGGLIKEYQDRYEWDVIHHQGLSLMKAYKRDFVSVEILY